MFRTIISRFANPGKRAVSAVSGNTYPPNISEKLCSLGFPSDLWLTEKQMTSIGVSLKESERGKGFSSETSNGVQFMIYNSSQTSDPSKVEQMKGRTLVMNALTKERIGGEAEKILNSELGSYQKNEWFTDHDANELKLPLKKGATPIMVNMFFNKTNMENGTKVTEKQEIVKGFYNVGQLSDLSLIERAQKLYPISASTGRRYGGETGLKLLREALAKNFDSPFWITMQGAQGLGLVIEDFNNGVEVQVSENKMLNFFNAKQTSNPAKVSTSAYKAQFAPRSAVSGAVYPEPTNSELSTISMKNKFKSVYWLTEKQAEFMDVTITPGSVCSEISMGDSVVYLYNADQTSSKYKVEARHKNY